jgi:hypothetical protein
MLLRCIVFWWIGGTHYPTLEIQLYGSVRPTTPSQVMIPNIGFLTCGGLTVVSPRRSSYRRQEYDNCVVLRVLLQAVEDTGRSVPQFITCKIPLSGTGGPDVGGPQIGSPEIWIGILGKQGMLRAPLVLG